MIPFFQMLLIHVLQLPGLQEAKLRVRTTKHFSNEPIEVDLLCQTRETTAVLKCAVALICYYSASDLEFFFSSFAFSVLIIFLRCLISEFWLDLLITL